MFWKYAANLQKNTNFTEIALRHGCSPVKLLHIFRTPFYKNISGGLLLISPIYIYFYKQLVLDPSPQNCLCFQDFQGSKFLNDSSVLWSNKQSLSVFRWFVSIRQSIFYEISSLGICVNIKALNRGNRKQLNILKTFLERLKNYTVA